MKNVAYHLSWLGSGCGANLRLWTQWFIPTHGNAAAERALGTTQLSFACVRRFSRVKLGLGSYCRVLFGKNCSWRLPRRIFSLCFLFYILSHSPLDYSGHDL